jgi:hypothetical protein
MKFDIRVVDMVGNMRTKFQLQIRIYLKYIKLTIYRR